MQSVAQPRLGAKTGADGLAGALHAERGVLIEFIGLLRTEQETLIRGDADGLAAIASMKEDLVLRLNHFGKQRSERLAARGLPATAAGMTSLLNGTSPHDAEAGLIWQEILSHAETAQQINNSNGLLISAGLKENRLKLGVLRNASAGSTYSADGHLGPLRGSRSLSQA